MAGSREFFYQFGKLLYQIDSFYDEFAKQSNVPGSVMWVLYALDDGRWHSQKEICQTWQIPTSTVNTVIKKLEREGYVAFDKVQGQKREKQVLLSNKGKVYAKKVLEKIYRIEDEVFASLGREAAQTNKNLGKILTILRRGK